MPASLHPICTHLHSTMYLFQRDRQKRGRQPLRYLHSTMYLFQLSRMETWKHIVHNLHSTMYLFQQAIRTLTLNTNIIYIPLCIYFNWPIYVIAALFPFIYIPLCIYFNPKLHYLIFVTFYLHSTMYLFQLGHLELSHAYNDIYIPLCIYFNSH